MVTRRGIGATAGLGSRSSRSVNVASAADLLAFTQQRPRWRDWRSDHRQSTRSGATFDGPRAPPAPAGARKDVASCNFTSTAATIRGCASRAMACLAYQQRAGSCPSRVLCAGVLEARVRAVNIQPGGVSAALASTTLDKMP